MPNTISKWLIKMEKKMTQPWRYQKNNRRSIRARMYSTGNWFRDFEFQCANFPTPIRYIDELKKNLALLIPEKPVPRSFQFGCSKSMIDLLKEKTNASDEIIFGIPVKESNLFPFEILYNACDIETRQEIKIPSGEWCHGVIVPDDYNPTAFREWKEELIPRSQDQVWTFDP
jgi:hypothetical protein